MLPTQWGDVGKQACVDISAAGNLTGDDFTEFPCVPIYDDRGQQIKAGNAMLLSFGRTVADFSASVEVDGPFQCVMGFALVQADLRPALQVDITEPVQHED